MNFPRCAAQYGKDKLTKRRKDKIKVLKDELDHMFWNLNAASGLSNLIT